MLGSLLIEKIVGFPDPLIEDRSIFLFMLLGGPLSCLIPSTVANMALYELGMIDWGQIPANWFGRWIGEMMGVLVFTPIILIAFAQPRNVWRERIYSVGLPLMATFVLMVVLYSYVWRHDEKQRRQDFEDQTVTLSLAIINRLQADMQAIDTVRNFFYGSTAIGAGDTVSVSSLTVTMPAS